MSDPKKETIRPFGFLSASTFPELMDRNPTVRSCMLSGGTAEDCAVRLAADNERLIELLKKQLSIIPRKIRLPDGRVMIWRCPDELIPESETW